MMEQDTVIRMILVFVMFSAKAFDHNWKNLPHDHPVRKPWIDKLAIANWYHIASAAVTWPVAAYLIYPSPYFPSMAMGGFSSCSTGHVGLCQAFIGPHQYRSVVCADLAQIILATV